MRLSFDISSHLGGHLESIRDLDQRKGFLKWITCAWDAMMKKETPINTSNLNFGSYDMMIIGTPVWAGNMTPAIRTFINKMPLGSSNVALFASCGRDTGCSLDEMSEILSRKGYKVSLRHGFKFSGRNPEDIKRETSQFSADIHSQF
jgi:flavorubredoxin